MTKKSTARCGFCGRADRDVSLMLTGLDGCCICSECVEQAWNVIQEHKAVSGFSPKPWGARPLPKPMDIKEHLDQYVIGQDEAKKTLAVAVYNHYKRLTQKVEDDGVELEKSNIIMVGSTGTGKTLLARTIAKMLDVPFSIVDATVFTEAGYVGEDVESILSRLLQAADYDVAAAERGIVFIDEIDKVARKGDNPSITRDVSGEGVQQAMLKLLEGSTVNVPPKGGRKHPDQDYVKIDVKRIDQKDMMKYIQPQDLKSFGLIPELIGRLPVLTHLDPLDRTALRRILTEPKNSLIRQQKKLFKMDDIELTFEEDALDYIVDKAVEFKLGARGLRSIVEDVMQEAQFDAPSSEKKQIRITKDYIMERLARSERLAS